jgi:hypothetical protein
MYIYEPWNCIQMLGKQWMRKHCPPDSFEGNIATGKCRPLPYNYVHPPTIPGTVPKLDDWSFSGTLYTRTYGTYL